MHALTPEAGARAARRASTAFALSCLLPILAFMVAFFVWPLLGSLVNSLHPYSLAGIDTSRWTLANYRKLLDPYYLEVLWRTIRISFTISAITAVLAYPVAWFIVRLPPARQAYLLMLYITPWLVNIAVKAFGWTLLLSPNGMINRALEHLGLIHSPLALMFNATGIVIGLVHAHFMFILLPLWGALSGLDRNLLWAAESLGARGPAVFRRIVLPLTLPALLAGTIINFTMNMAAFATPALLGGARVRVISFVAYTVNLVDLNWPLGAAMALALLVITLAMVSAAQRVLSASARGTGAG